MTEHENVKIIAFVGMPGAGKTEAVDYITQKGFPKIYFGGIMYDEMRKQGIEITPESQKLFRTEWREREGDDVIVRRAMEQVHHLIGAGQHNIILDGIYAWAEYKILKHEFPGESTVVAIVAPRHTRHHRLANRSERPFTGEEANDRDWAEIENLGKGGPIAIADYYIVNDSSLSELHAQVDTVLRDIHF